METINFQCGNCGNLMAVGAENLGQQVRCPHCQQVVVAPPPAAPPPSMEVTFPLRPVGEPESIFSTPEENGDDLFGGPPTPRVEMPAEPPAAPDNGPVEGLPPPFPAPYSSTLTYAPPPTEPGASPHVPAETSGTAVVEGQAASWMDSPLSPPDGFAVIPRTTRRPAQGGGGWFIALVFVPLVSYSVLATIALIILWNRLQVVPPHPLEFIPDVEGDNPGAVKNPPKKQAHAVIRPEAMERLAELPVPPHLRVALGKTLRIGDLKVTPTRVERKVVKVFVEGPSKKPEPCLNESLVLHLHFRNVSADATFLPMDNYFDRHWQRGQGPPPLTQLEMVGTSRFYGGPAHWYPRQRLAKDRTDREWVEGRKNFYEHGLEPGEEMDTFVCTDGQDAKVIASFEKHKGELLWHVQVRRGLVQVGNRELPASAVLGVEFTAEDVAVAEQD